MLLLPATAAADRAVPPSAPPTPPATRSADELIVEWAGQADRSDRIEARGEADVSFESDLGNRRFQLVSVRPGQTAAEAVSSLEADPSVAVAERDGYRAINALPNDPLFGQLWGLRNLGTGIDGFNGAIAGADINAPAAWNRTVGSPSIVIADIDSGYRFEYEDLNSVAWTNPGESGGTPGVDDDGNGIVDDLHGADFIGANGEAPTQDGDPTDEDLISGGHGVHTAGTMGAAGNNGVGITGVAQNVRIMPLRVCSRFPNLGESRCRTSSIVAAINYAAAKGARVANMSLGGNEAQQAEVDAIAAAKHTLFVISAGNDGSDNDGAGSAPHGHHYPCDFRPDQQASGSIPGPIDNIVCVAATNQADGLAGFSDWGAASVDLGAPGTETLSAYPYGTRFQDTFTTNDFATKWVATGADGGFTRTNESPLTSFGMTDLVGAPAANTVREVTSAPVTIPANGGCRLTQSRHVSLASGDQYRYAVLLNGVEQSSSTPASSPASGMETRFLDLASAFKSGGEVQVQFRFTTGSSPTAGSGIWLDDITLVCSEPVGTATSYGYLQGTSMAAPHVTGGAALLFSLEPGASVTEVRQALLEGVDAVPSLAGNTTSGGRLDVAKAMEALEGELGISVVEELPPGTVEKTEAEIRAASPPATVSQPPKPICKVPSLAGKSLGQAKAKLAAANCTLGSVTKPKAKKGRRLPPLVVRLLEPGARLALLLGQGQPHAGAQAEAKEASPLASLGDAAADRGNRKRWVAAAAAAARARTRRALPGARAAAPWLAPGRRADRPRRSRRDVGPLPGAPGTARRRHRRPPGGDDSRPAAAPDRGAERPGDGAPAARG